MKKIREQTIQIMLLLLVLCFQADGIFSQLLFKDETSSFFQINQPLMLELKNASETLLAAKLEFPVAVMIVNGSDTRQITLDSGFFATLPELLDSISALAFKDTDKNKIDKLRSLAHHLMPRHWRFAMVGAMAGFFWLTVFFLEGKIAITARAITNNPAAALFGGFAVVLLLVATIVLSFYSIIGIPVGLMLFIIIFFLVAVSPAVVIATVCEAFVPGISGLKKWLLMAVFSLLTAGLLLNRFAWFLFLPVATALTASSLRNRFIDFDSKGVRDESSI